MLATMKQMAAVGVTVGTVGWVSIVSPAMTYSQPPSIPPEAGVTCPSVAGISYLLDPDDSNAYYICVDGSAQNHYQCPTITRLILATPPKCASLSPHMP